MTCGTQFQIWYVGSDYGIVENQKIALYIGVFALTLPIVYAITLKVFENKLMHKSIRDKIQSMYLDVHTFKSSSSKYYLPISMVRRILYAGIPALLYAYPIFQLQSLLFINTIYIAWYAYVRPHIERRRIQTECFNEMMIICFIYQLMMFTDFLPDTQM